MSEATSGGSQPIVFAHGAAATERTGTKIHSLQWLRFCAALMVVLYHTSVYQRIMLGNTWADGIVPGWFGPVGVGLFFALSGHLMASAMMRTDAPHFILHRIARIYPAFFAAVAIFAVVGQFSPIKLPLDVRALSLLPWGGGAYPLGVEWTLVFEIAFYVFVFLLILLKQQRQAASILVGWLGLIFIHNVLWPDDPTTNVYSPLALPFVGVNVAFAAGMLLPLITKISIHPIVAVILAGGMFLYGATISITFVRWGIGFGSALLVLSLARFSGWPALFGQTWLGRLGNRLGDYSYALYLCHVPIIRTIYASFPNANPQVLFAASVTSALLVCVPLGIADTAAYRWLKRMIDKSSGSAATVPAAMFIALFLAAIVLHTFPIL